MQLQEINRYCDLFIKQNERREVLADDFLREQKIDADAQLLGELLKLEIKLRLQRSNVKLNESELHALFADNDSVNSSIEQTVDIGLDQTADNGATPDDSLDSISIGRTLDSKTRPAFSQALASTESLAGKQFGDYELIEEIARGAMGVVFKARQRKLNRVVALKMILSGQLASDEELRRFYQEAESAANLHHPGIVPVYEVGEVDGQHFFSMGFVEGESLASRISDRPLESREAAELLKKIATAVDYAHKHGVVHRDLKPANVLVDPTGEPKVTDFGLAKQAEADSHLTATGQVLGTPAYMPPEQATGRIHETGPLSDVYSLGAVLYATLTGRPPFQAATVVDTLMQVVDRDPVPPLKLNPAISQDIETICLKCLNKEPSHRYASANEIADDLGRYLRNEPIQARATGNIEKVTKWIGRHRIVSFLLAAVAATMLIGTAVSLWFAMEANERATAEGIARQDLVVKEQEAKQLAEEKTELAEARQGTITELEDYLYVSRLREAQQAYDSGDYDTARRLLKTDLPEQGEHDRRCFVWRHLAYKMRHADPEVISVPGFRAQNKKMAVSPDGKLMAVAGIRSVQIISVDTMETQSIESMEITGVCFSNDSRVLFVAFGSGSAYRAYKLKGVRAYKIDSLLQPLGEIRVDEEYGPFGICVAASPTEPLIACALEGGKILLWDYKEKKVRAELSLDEDYGEALVQDVFSLDFSPDGKKLASARFGYSVDLWDVALSKHESRIRKFQSKVPYRNVTFNRSFWSIDMGAVKFSPDGKKLAAAANGMDLFIADLETKQIKNCYGHTDAVTSIDFLPDGERFVSSSFDQDIRIWDSRNGIEIQKIGSHRAPIHSVAVLPGGTKLMSLAIDEQLRTWQIPAVDESVEVVNLRNQIYWLTFQPGSDYIVTSGWPVESVSGVCFVNYESGSIEKPSDRFSDRSHCNAVSADGSVIVGANLEGNSIWVWNAKHELIKTIPTKFNVNRICLHPDGNFVIAYPPGGASAAILIDIAAGDVVKNIKGRSCYSPNGKILATIDNGKLVLRDAHSLRIISEQPLTEEGRPVFSPDSKLLAFSQPNSQVLVYDIEQQKVVFRGKKHYRGVTSVAFCPDGKTLASSSLDQRVLLWDLKTGQVKAELRGHRGQIESVAFNATGTILASAGKDYTIRFWRTKDEVNLEEKAIVEQPLEVHFEPKISESADVVDLSDRELLEKRRFSGLNSKDVSVGPSGLRIHAEARPEKARILNVEFPVSLSGDFEITTKIRDIQLPAHTDNDCSVGISLVFEPDSKQRLALSCKTANNAPHVLSVTRSYKVDGTRKDIYGSRPRLADPEIRLRIIRQGDTVYYLQSKWTADDFQLIRADAIPDPNARVSKVFLHALAKSVDTAATYTEISIRSEEHPDDESTEASDKKNAVDSGEKVSPVDGARK